MRRQYIRIWESSHPLRPDWDTTYVCIHRHEVLHAFLTASAQQPLEGLGLLIIEASRSHSDTPQSVGLLWTSDQPDAETSTGQHTALTSGKYPCYQRDSNPQSQRPHIHAFDRADTGIDSHTSYKRETQCEIIQCCVELVKIRTGSMASSK